MTTIASLGSQSATASPIQLVPPEILGKIFGLAVAASKQAYDVKSSSYTAWYNFTYVSRHWRSVALSTPHIWGTLLFLSRKIISVMLERSKMADLSIDVDFCHPHFLSMITLVEKTINEHTSRITGMILKVGAGTLLVLLKGLQQRPRSLRLRELRLDLTSGIDQLFPDAILVPEHLQVLDAHGFNFAWDAEPFQSFPRLTHLTISTNLKVPLPEFIAALCGMPALEVLHMRNSLPSEPPVLPVQPVHIATLRELIITSTQDSSQISNFLPFITVPATTNVQICCFASMRRPPTAKLSALALSLRSLIRSMHVEGDGSGGCYYKSVWVCLIDGGLQIVASRTDIGMDLFAIDFELTIACRRSPEDILRKIFPAFPRDKILSLRLEIGLRSETLLELSDTLPCLRHVILGRESMPNFIAVMTLEQQSLPFQHLRCITLYCAKFSPRINYGLEVSELRHCLEERSRSNAKLEMLNILRCRGIHEHDIQRLREIVDVEWIGIDEIA